MPKSQTTNDSLVASTPQKYHYIGLCSPGHFDNRTTAIENFANRARAVEF
jgi:hypothetical protein